MNLDGYAEWLDQLGAAETDDAMWELLGSMVPPEVGLERIRVRNRVAEVLKAKKVSSPGEIAKIWEKGASSNGAAPEAESAPDGELRETAELIGKAIVFVRRYVVLPDRVTALTIALWVLHTWVFESFEATPYLIIDSATKRCGKTTLERVLELLVSEPWRAVSTSEAAMFRRIEMQRPTLLLDELDLSIGSGKGQDRHDPMVALLNAGNTAGASVTRMVGEGAGMEPKDFSTFCPKVLAGQRADKWPPTILDRGPRITLQRRKSTEPRERLRVRDVRDEADQLRELFARWAYEHKQVLAGAHPHLPETLNDREVDYWEPLFAIADLAAGYKFKGDVVPISKKAREAAVGLAVEDETDNGQLALHALRALFKDHEVLATETIVDALNENEELPFGGWRKGGGIDGRGLARLLKAFRKPDGSPIRPRVVRIMDLTPRGYHREWFVDAWARYPSSACSEGSDPQQAQHPSNDGGFGDFSMRNKDPDVAHSETAESPVNTGGVADVADTTCPEGPNTFCDEERGDYEAD